MDATTIIRSIETDSILVHLREDGILHVHIKRETSITIAVQEEMLRVYNDMTDIRRPFLFTGDEFVTITKEARKNALRMERNVPLLATAIVVKNTGQRILANYYYKFNPPKRPYRVFTNELKAIAWLNENYQILV